MVTWINGRPLPYKNRKYLELIAKFVIKEYIFLQAEGRYIFIYYGYGGLQSLVCSVGQHTLFNFISSFVQLHRLICSTSSPKNRTRNLPSVSKHSIVPIAACVLMSVPVIQSQRTKKRPEKNRNRL